MLSVCTFEGFALFGLEHMSRVALGRRHEQIALRFDLEHASDDRSNVFSVARAANPSFKSP